MCVKGAIRFLSWVVIIPTTIVGLLVSSVYMSEMSVSQQCDTIPVGASYDSVLFFSSYKLMTSIYVVSESSELWISNRIIGTVFCEIEFNELQVRGIRGQVFDFRS